MVELMVAINTPNVVLDRAIHLYPGPGGAAARERDAIVAIRLSLLTNS
jgi:hypothetical protein